MGVFIGAKCAKTHRTGYGQLAWPYRPRRVYRVCTVSISRPEIASVYGGGGIPTCRECTTVIDSGFAYDHGWPCRVFDST